MLKDCASDLVKVNQIPSDFLIGYDPLNFSNILTKILYMKEEEEVKIYKTENIIQKIKIPNVILMDRPEIKKETMNTINEMIHSCKTIEELYSKIDKSDVISMDEEKTHHLLVSKVLSKTTVEEKKKSEKKMKDLSSKVFNKFATNSNHYENLLEGTDSLEFALVLINEMLKKTNNMNIIFSDKILSRLEEDHYMKYLCFGSEA